MRVSTKNWLTGIFLTLGIVTIYFIIKQHGIKNILNAYKSFDPLMLFFYGFSVFVLILLLNLRWSIILKSRKINIPFRKLLIYRVIGTSISFLTPGPRVGGEPTQASLLTKHNVKFTEGLSTIMIDKIIDITISGLLFIIGVSLIGLKYGISGSFGIVLFIIGIMFVIITLVFYYRMLKSKHFFLKIFRILKLDKINNKKIRSIEKKLEEIELMMIDFYNNNKKAFVKTIIISMLTWVIMFFEYKFATKLLGFDLNIIEIFFIISFIGIAVLFPIPMAIGALEAGQISAFTIIGLPASAGVALAFLVRLKDLTISLIGLILLGFYGFHVPKVIKKKYINKREPLSEELKIKNIRKNNKN